jgi:hypothetical protein
MTGLEKALDGVDWKPIERIQVVGHDVYATHEGFIHLDEETLHVFKLSNGERVVDADDISRLLGLSVEEIEAHMRGQ